jgi:hypothetical protein
MCLQYQTVQLPQVPPPAPVQIPESIELILKSLNHKENNPFYELKLATMPNFTYISTTWSKTSFPFVVVESKIGVLETEYLNKKISSRVVLQKEVTAWEDKK